MEDLGATQIGGAVVIVMFVFEKIWKSVTGMMKDMRANGTSEVKKQMREIEERESKREVDTVKEVTGIKKDVEYLKVAVSNLNAKMDWMIRQLKNGIKFNGGENET